MYKFLRDSHLLLGLFFSTFVLMFGISSLRFAHPDWISAEPVVKPPVSLEVEVPADARSLAKSLMDEHGYRGNFDDLRETDEGYEFNIWRFATTHKISYTKQLNRVEIETSERPFISVLLGMHFTFGFGHDNWFSDLLGLFNLLVSVALLLLGATGIYLWFKIFKERLVGSIILFTSLFTLLALIVSMRTA